MRRKTLITGSPSVPASGNCRCERALAWYRLPMICLSRQAALALGLMILTQGCQTSGSLSKLFGRQPQDQVASVDDKKSILSVLDGDKLDESKEAGLPRATKSQQRENADDRSLVQRLDEGHAELAKYYSDGSTAHLTSAHRIYEEALALSPGSSESHHGLAIVSDLQKDYSSAELHYRAALEDDPRNGKILGDLGYSYLLQGKFSDAEATLLKATELDPANDQASKNLAYVYAKQGDYNLAESTFRKVMNETEVRNEMVQLFPQGRPDMARENERAKAPWRQKEIPTTVELKNRLDTAREQSLAEARDRKSALDSASPETLTIEQQKARIAQLEWERNEALRLLDERQAAASQQAIVIGPAPQESQGVVSNLRGPASSEARVDGGGSPFTRPASAQGGGRRVTNSFYPQGNSSDFRGQGAGIQQTRGTSQQPGVPDQSNHQHALHQTDHEIDPRTGQPLNSGIEQIDGQAPSPYMNHPRSTGQYGQGTPVSPQQFNNQPRNYEPSGQMPSSAEETKRRAAMFGLGGPEMMFQVPSIDVPRIDGGNRLAPGTGSTWNGGQYPQPQRALPTDAAPHDLQELMQSPSGQMTVAPNNMGMLNSPTGRSFANPNFEQRLSPQIPLDSPMGSQAMNYVEQTQFALSENPTTGGYPDRAGSPASNQPYPTWNTATPSSPSQAGTGTNDPRNRVNASLNEYGQSFRHNPAEQNSNGWGQVPSPAYGLPSQPALENPSQLINRGWNQQQMTPQMTPLPYSERLTASDEQSTGQYGNQYGQGSASDTGYGSTDQGATAYPSYGQRLSTTQHPPSSQSMAEPAPIYSQGARIPAGYSGSNGASNLNGQFYNGPRITPAQR